MPTGDIYELNVDMELSGQAVTNVHHFRQEGADGTGDPREALANVWDDYFKTTAKTLAVIGLTFVQTRNRQIKPVQTQQFFNNINESGDIPDPGMPTGSCVLIRFYTENAGPKGIGGMKVVGASIDNIEFGRVNVAYANLCQAHADLFGITYTDSGSGFKFIPCVYSQIDNVAREIVLGVVLTRAKTVHSRQVGVGT